MCVRDGHAGAAVGRQLAAAVEAEPADPEQARAHRRHARTVRGMHLVGEATPGTEHGGNNQRRHAGAQMHHQAAREIHHAEVGKPAAAPYPVAHRRIDEEQPGPADHQHRRELDALHIGAHDQRRGDDREGHLEHGENDLGDAPRHRVGGDSRKQGLADAAHDAADRRVEREAVAHKDPQHAGQAGDGEALHDDGQHRLRPHQTGVEHRQPRQGHHQDQRGGDDDPGRIARVQRRSVLRRSRHGQREHGERRRAAEALAQESNDKAFHLSP